MIDSSVDQLKNKAVQPGRILEKQNCLQMSQVFSVSAHKSVGWFCFSRILSIGEGRQTG
jgi:hypothetical protein